MIGSTIIAEKDASRLAEINSVHELEDFVCLELETMATLDFETIVAEGGFKWAQGEPIQFDPDGGMAIFKIDEKGLSYVLERLGEFDKAKQAELQKLADFVRAHGKAHLYEFASF